MVFSMSGIYSASLHSSFQPLCLFSLIVFLRLLQSGARAGSLVRWQKMEATEARVKTTESVCSQLKARRLLRVNGRPLCTGALAFAENTGTLWTSDSLVASQWDLPLLLASQGPVFRGTTQRG